MKRGLVFAKYGTRAASTRQRFVQAMPYLNAAGISIDIQPLFDNAYLDRLFADGSRHPMAVLRAYAARMKALLTCKEYDFLWVHCELFPYLPGWMEALIGCSKKPILYDFDDAIFHQYDQHKRGMVRQLLGEKLRPLLRRSDLAFCGNTYLSAYASRDCKRTEIVPTTVDVTVYGAGPTKPPSARPAVGWIGSPSTWNYCIPFTDMLADLVAQHTLDVLVVGAGASADARHPFEFRQWSETREVADVQAMDIGIMPIPDAPWARGKCGYKLIQYMACGVPVIASPVGVNCEIVTHGVNGFLATTQQEWRSAIETLAADAALRKRMGAAGRSTVEQHYSIQQYGPRMAEWIHSICPGG